MNGKSLVEKYAIRCSKENNGDEWATHYTEEQKEYWREFVRDLIVSITQELFETVIESVHEEDTNVVPE